MRESRETYLETILILEQEKGYVRSIDVAKHLNYSKPSISRAMSLLRRDGLLVMKSDGQLVLTETGRKRAKEIYERHCMLTEFLQITLGMEEKAAAEDACRMEHVISQEAFLRVKDFIKRQDK